MKAKRLKLQVPAAAICAFLLAWAAPAWAADPDTAALARQIKELVVRVQILENRVQKLEHAPQGSTADMDKAAEQAARKIEQHQDNLRENWRNLEEGMPQEQVKILLGAPQKAFRLGGQLVWYYYYPGVGGGSVFFSSTGHLSGSQKPPFGGFGF